jgi:hypothetical protein
MRKLFIPRNVCDRLVAIVCRTPAGLETGVTLLGTSVTVSEAPLRESAATSGSEPGSGDVVLAVAGPGCDATHEPARYSGDENYANAFYESLQIAMPGIRWLGELHVHPPGMTRLSAGDLRTIREILAGDDETLHPDQFIAGVMMRGNGRVAIHPFHFTRDSLAGVPMEIEIVDPLDGVVRQARLKGVEHDRPYICAESPGSGTAVEGPPRHHRVREWWECACRYGGAVWCRLVHAGRPRNART